MIQEFKAFIAKGNVLMLAVGFIMGVAFQAVVTSLVDNVIMPIVAIPFGEPNFDELMTVVYGSEIMWGAFVATAVTFLLTAIAVFLFIVKPYNAYRARFTGPDGENAGPTEVELLTQIRDLLARRSD